MIWTFLTMIVIIAQFMYEICTKIYEYLEHLKNLIYINILIDLIGVYKHCIKIFNQ